jgi:predicted MFS family arabinose efflux permease
MTTEPSSAHRGRVIGGLGLTQIFAWGSSYYLPAVLSKPMAEDTGWSLAWVTGGLSLALLASGLFAPTVARLIRARGPRLVLGSSSVLLALGLVTIGLSTKLPLFLLGWIILGFGMGCGLYDASFMALGTLYGTRARSAITTLTLYGGFASTICWPLSTLLLDQFGWRGVCLVYAALQACLCGPMMLLILPKVPITGMAAAPAAPSPQAPAVERRAPLALLGLIFTLSSFVASVIGVQLLALLQAGGISLASAVFLGTLVGPAQVGGRVLEMATGERFHPVWTMFTSALLIALGMVILLTGAVPIAAGLILFGAGNGIFSIARGTLPLALVGPARYPATMGTLARPAQLSSAAAPFLAGILYEHWGAGPSWLLLAALAASNLALVVLLIRVVRKKKV